MAMTATTEKVGMGEIHVSKGSVTWECAGIGCGVCVALLDPTTKVSGMVHYVLPAVPSSKECANPVKYAEPALTGLIAQMVEAGAAREAIIAAYAGGATSLGDKEQNQDMGARNTEATANLLSRLGVRTVASDTGTHFGRTMTLSTASGVVRVGVATGGETVLCTLRG